MFRILVADFVVEIQNRFKYIEKFCTEYIYKGDRQTDITVQVTDEDIAEEQKVAEGVFSDPYTECVCAYRKLCMQLPERDAILVHGSTIAYKDKGIIFLARSGVGKSTHTMLWKQAYGDDVVVVNGDKPIVRFVDGVPYAYGTPWAGKEGMQVNTRVKLTDICFLERALENSTDKIHPRERVDALMQQILHPDNPVSALKTLELVDSIVSKCNNWIIRCNPTLSAAQTAHDAICM